MTKEREASAWPGWPVLALAVALYAFAAGVLVHGGVWEIWAGAGAIALAALTSMGFFTLQPNEARALILFGRYTGTTRQVGFLWANPLFSNSGTVLGRLASARHGSGPEPLARRLPRYKISLRARTLNGERLKVNDRAGNPIDIAAVVIWHVDDTAQALFDVDDFEAYVTLQSETALRHLATSYAYDHGEMENGAITLRGNVEQVSAALKEELGRRLTKAGVAVDEARLTHLAYAPEIAQAMLRRQQAEAVIAARQKIVQGAVGMVDQALHLLSERQVVELDEERKAAMVSNLMVVLCGESQVSPIVNTGTLYQ